MNITYFRVYTDEDTDSVMTIEISDTLSNCKFMIKQYSKLYYISLSVDGGKIYFPITDDKGKEIIFNDTFTSVLDLFFSYMDEYHHLTININKAFKQIQEDLKCS